MTIMMVMICGQLQYPWQFQMPASAWEISPSLSDVQRPQNVPSRSPPQAPGGRQIFRVLSTKTDPGARDWVFQSDSRYGKQLWVARAPRLPPIHDQMFQIKSVDILNVSRFSQARQPAVFFLLSLSYLAVKPACCCWAGWQTALASPYHVLPNSVLAEAVQVKTGLWKGTSPKDARLGIYPRCTGRETEALRQPKAACLWQFVLAAPSRMSKPHELPVHIFHGQVHPDFTLGME